MLPAAFPWVRYLPKDEMQSFVVEFVDVLERAESAIQRRLHGWLLRGATPRRFTRIPSLLPSSRRTATAAVPAPADE